MFRLKAVRLFYILLVLLHPDCHQAHADTSSNLKVAYVRNLISIFADIEQDAALGKMQRRQILVHAISKEIDFEWSARAVLGRYWRTATSEERSAFVSAYRENLIRTWCRKLAKVSWNRNSVKVLDKVRPVNASDDEVVCNLSLSHGRDVVLAFRVRNDHPRILNMSIDGLDVVTIYRSQFLGYIEKNGLLALINDLTSDK